MRKPTYVMLVICVLMSSNLWAQSEWQKKVYEIGGEQVSYEVSAAGNLSMITQGEPTFEAVVMTANTWWEADTGEIRGNTVSPKMLELPGGGILKVQPPGSQGKVAFSFGISGDSGEPSVERILSHVFRLEPYYLVLFEIKQGEGEEKAAPEAYYFMYEAGALVPVEAAEHNETVQLKRLFDAYRAGDLSL